MTTPEMLHKRFWCRETDEKVRVEFTSESGFWRSSFDIPGGWGIDGGYRRFGVLESLDDCGKRLSDLAGEAEP